MVSTAPATVATTCRRCFGRGWHFCEGGPDEWPLEVSCHACADPGDDDDPDDGDDCRAEDDLPDAAPDDATRFAFVAARYPAAA